MSRAAETVIRPAHVVRTGGPALYLGPTGALERVVVTSDSYMDPEDGVVLRACNFLDRDGEEFDAPVDRLRPCNEAFEIDRPEALRSPKSPRVDSVEKDGGRVYAPEAMPRTRPSDDEQADHDPMADERARIDHGALTEGQSSRLVIADFYAERADALRVARPARSRVSAEEKAAGDMSRRILIRLRREVLEGDQSDAARRRIRHAEHLADQAGRAVRRKAMQGRRLRLQQAGLSRAEATRHLWEYRGFLRRTVQTGRNIDGLTLVALSPIQKWAAIWYRELYQRTERGARVAQWDGQRVGDGRDRPAEDWGADQITRKQVEAKVMAACKNGRGITALRLVAGDSRTINSISGGKSQNRKLNTEALIAALDVVADYRKCAA